MRNKVKGAIIRRKLISFGATELAWHYAIDAGDDDVIHFYPEHNKRKKKLNGNRCPGIVSKDSREDFDWEIVENPTTEHQANAILNISLEFVGKEIVYDLENFNCEHFAKFCFKAEIQSDQADQILVGKRVAGPIIFGTTTAATSVAANAAIVASTPAATVLTSEYLGSLAVYYGVMAAPTAPAWAVVAAGAAAVTVSAAVGTAVFKWVQKNPSDRIPPIKESVQKECIICMEHNVCMRFLPCNHMIACLTCSNRIRECPQCRSQIENKVQVYESVRLNS